MLSLPDKNLTMISEDEIQQSLEKQVVGYDLHEYFNLFYFNRTVNTVDIEALTQNQTETGSFIEIYPVSIDNELRSYYRNASDLVTLKSIKEEQISLTEFEFDDEIYQKDQIEIVIVKLQEEINTQEAFFKQKDEQAFIFNYITAKLDNIERAEEYKELYAIYQNLNNETLKYSTLLSRFYSYSVYLSSFTYPSEQVLNDACNELNELLHLFKTNLEESKQLTIKNAETIDLSEGYYNYLLKDSSVTPAQLTEFNATIFNNTFNLVANVLDKVNGLKQEKEIHLLEFQKKLSFEKVSV
ncbi:hypothetical protein D3C78_1195080 [compost metagenome]